MIIRSREMIFSKQTGKLSDAKNRLGEEDLI
jgi:hypothetical protein